MAASPDPARVFKARTLLRVLQNRHEQYIDAIVDAAQLAVNQVQDKRIEFKELPKVEIEDIFFEIMFELLPFGDLVHRAVKRFTLDSYESLLRTRFAFKLLGKEGYPVLLQLELSEVLSRAERLSMKRYFLNHANVREIYSGNVHDFFEKIDGNIKSAKTTYDKVAAAYEKMGQVGAQLSTQATPGTRIMELALSFGRKFKYTQSALSLQLENALSAGIFDDNELDSLINFLGQQIKKAAYNYEDLRIAYVLWLELCIWITIYTPAHLPGNLEIKPFVTSGTLVFKGRTADNTDTFSTTLPPQIAAYLISRIANSPFIEVEGRDLPALLRLWQTVTTDIEVAKNGFVGKILK